MSLLLWPAAIAAFLAWSLAAWLLYGASDWLAGIAGGAMSGIFSEALGPWAQWILASLGNLIQIGIAAIWAIIGLLILSAPLLLRRLRLKPEYAGRGDGHDGEGHGSRTDRRWRDDNTKDNGAWRTRAHQARGDLDDLRFFANDMVEKYRGGKWKKKRKKWDDD